MSKSKERPLQVLEQTYQKLEAKLPFAKLPFYVVEKCYETEKNFLFEEDRSKPMDALKAIVEQYVDTEFKE